MAKLSPGAICQAISLPFEHNDQHFGLGFSIRILSDEELFAMFANRPLAIIGPPDSPQILFLDELK